MGYKQRRNVICDAERRAEASTRIELETRGNLFKRGQQKNSQLQLQDGTRCNCSDLLPVRKPDFPKRKPLVTSYLEAKFSTDEDFRRRVRKLAEMDGER